MKANNWEGGIRVPFIVRYPQVFTPGRTVKTPCWSADIFPTIAGLTGTMTDWSIILDGQDITPIINGESSSHAPVFSMKNSRIMTIRDGKWKLFVAPPEYYKETDLSNWTDPRGPDGTTIIAPKEQSTPEDYPGVKPEKMEGEMLLFDLEKDPGERINLSSQYPEIRDDLLKKYKVFLSSIPVR
jgi:arylsulfatase A-like enzyme